jgi:hypothetical protein
MSEYVHIEQRCSELGLCAAQLTRSRRIMPHHAHTRRAPHTAHRTPHTAHRTPHTHQRAPHTPAAGHHRISIGQLASISCRSPQRSASAGPSSRHAGSGPRSPPEGAAGRPATGPCTCPPRRRSRAAGGRAQRERGGGSGVTRAHERKRESRERAGGGEPLESRWRAVGEPLESGPAEEGSIRAVGSEGAVSPFAREPLESR